MEPLRGGQLAKKPPEAVAKVWGSDPKKRSPVEWAFRWVWDHLEVSLLLSGMSAMEQVVENVAIAERAGNSRLGKSGLALLDRVRQAYQGVCPVPCTGCRYCMPCPNGVEIPSVFRVYNEAFMYNDLRMGRMRYKGPFGLKDEQDASNCVECGKCAEACPQNIEVPDWLKKAHAELTS